MEPLRPELLAELRRGDAAAWDELHQCVAPLLRRWATRRVRDPGLADDLVQEVFLAFWQQVQQGRIGQREWERLPMWFGRLLKLRYRDIVVRKQGGARRGGVRQLTNYEWQSAMATYNNGQAASADQQILVEAIATLRKQDRQLLRWKLQRLTFAEIAERLSLPRPRVRLLIRQALAALRDRLQPSPRTQPDPQLRRRCA